jgi:ATP-dependent helicase Lhr and Lhr-like helicase
VLFICHGEGDTPVGSLMVRRSVDASHSEPLTRRRKTRVRESDTGHDRAVERSLAWLSARSMLPTPVQHAVFSALATPGPLLVTAPTGSGKTAAVMLPLLASLDSRLDNEPERTAGTRILYIAPVRALVDGHAAGLAELARGLDAHVRVDARSGDSSAQHRAKLRRAPPEVLVTTPETLAVMLATETRAMLATVECVVLDEVHLLASGKRGALFAATLEVLDAHLLANARPRARRVAMSATVRPLATLASWVHEGTRVVEAGGGEAPALDLSDPVMDAAFPSGPWLWRSALPTVARTLAASEGTSLVFVSARARAEQWTLALRDVLPARMLVACFHGSLSAEERAAVAAGVASRALRAVVATSGLEVGVDLPSVSRVMVLSSPPSVTRLLQAAGRADHRPGCAPRATLVPTSALDLVRCVAVLDAARRGDLEDVDLRAYDLDVVTQAALARIALSPCTRDEVAATLRGAWPFRDLDDDDLDEALKYLATGGDGLAAYPELARVVTDGTHWAIAGKRSLRRYMQAIGTIVGDVAVAVRNGAMTVGQVEGRFAGLLDVGDHFVLGARVWRVASLAAGEIQVRPARNGSSTVPSWAGARAAQSERVGASCERVWGSLETASRAGDDATVLDRLRAVLSTGVDNAKAVRSLLRAQVAVSALPTAARCVVELVRDGKRLHVVAFTLAGASANEVIARAVGARVRRATGGGCEVSVSDECACVTLTGLPREPDEETLRAWLSPHDLFDDLLDSLDGSVLAAAYFREVARVAQLWTPERGRGTVTPGLLYDVLRKHDPDHLLLRALRFTVWTALDGPRAERRLTELARRPWHIATLGGPSPLSIPVFAWSARDTVAPDDPESALAAAAHALFQRASALVGDDA